MILTCPACATQYRLKDGAIPPEGRQVRCAACKHKWHQDGDGRERAAATAAARPADGRSPPARRMAAMRHRRRSAAARRRRCRAAGRQRSRGRGARADDRRRAASPRSPTARSATTGADADAAAPMRRAGRAAHVGRARTSSRDEDYGFAAIPAMHDEDEPRRGSMLGWIVGLVLLVVAAAAASISSPRPN